MSKSNYWTCSLSMMAAAVGFALACSLFLATRTPGAGQTAKPTSSAYEKLLTVADVESATGIKGTKRVAPGSVRGTGGNLNFAQADGSLLLMVRFGDAELFKKWKAQEGLFKSAVNDIGDEAFIGPAVENPYVLYVRKRNQAFSLSSFLNTDTLKPLVNQNQLRSLAKIILPRL